MTSRKNKTHYFDNGTPRASSPTTSSCRKIASLGVGYPTLVSFANSSLLTPHFSFLIPHFSFLISHSSFLISHSSLLIPHSSFLISTSFLHNTNTPITFGTAISPLKISDTPHTSSMLHIVPMHPQAIAMIL